VIVIAEPDALYGQVAGGGGKVLGGGVPVAERERLDVPVAEVGQAFEGAGTVGSQGVTDNCRAAR
jgi:hypothetical protein